MIWHYLHSRMLPVFIPKLTTIFNRKDEEWDVDIYIDSNQTEAYERSLAQVFLKNDPHFLSLNTRYLAQNGNNLARSNSSEFSINEYFLNILRFRPLLLKFYQGCFRIVCFILKLPYKKAVKSQNDN